MRRRLRTTLVYFGLVEDPVIDAQLQDRPMNAWHVAALGAVIALALGALWLVGVDLSWGTLVSVVVALGAFSAARSAIEWVRRRESRSG